MATISTFGDDDTEGESVLIGEEDSQVQLQTEPFHRTGTSLGGGHNSTGNQANRKNKARSPPQKTQNSKIGQHNKHKVVRKSPMTRDLKLNHSSRIPSDQLAQND